MVHPKAFLGLSMVQNLEFPMESLLNLLLDSESSNPHI